MAIQKRLTRVSLFLAIFFVFLVFFGSVETTSAAVRKITRRRAVVTRVNPAKIGGYDITEEGGQNYAIKNSAKAFPVASLTKMMTALVFSENRQKDWSDIITYNPARHFVYGNYLKFKKGDQTSVNDLLRGMLIGSINEPAEMLVEATNFSEEDFVKAMNNKAKELGMINTIYVDPSGISPSNVSSPADQIKLLQVVFNNSELREVMDTEEYKMTIISAAGAIKNKLVRHTNSLIGTKQFEILASKTGYLQEAHNNIAMVIQKNGRVYYVVTLGDPSRYRDFRNTQSLIQKTILAAL